MSNDFRKYNVYQPTNRRLAPDNRGPNKNYSGKLLPIIIGLVFVLGLGAYINYSAKAAAREAAIAAQAARLTEQKNFASKVEALIKENSEIAFSVTAIDLKSGETQSVGKNQPVNAASTTKLITATLYLREVEQGRRSLNDPVAWFSGNDALRKLVNRSNDTVWSELNDDFGDSKLAAYASSLGIDDYEPESNKISSKSIAVFLQKLYKGELLNSKNTATLLSYMQKTNYENFIPPAVDKNLKLHHKVGLIEDYVNDAAVISDGTNEFALVIFTNGNGAYNWGQRAELMQQITRLATDAYL